MSRGDQDSPRNHRREDDRHRHSSKAKKSSKDKRHHRHHVDRTELPSGVVPISEDDYFLRATEFRVWLKQRKNKYVEELSTDDAMHYFQSKFVKRWNSGRLDRMYYTGIPESVLEQTKRTRHTWGFVNNLNDKERMDLATTKDSVSVSTRKADLISSRPSDRVSSDGQETTQESHDHHRRRGYHNRDDEEDEHDRRQRRRLDDRRQRKHRDHVMEELVPKETGREAQIEKRRQLADRLHGAARDRDANRDGLDLDDGFLMGSHDSNDNLQRRLAQRADVRQRRDDDRRERVAAAQANEAARMDKFLKDMGIDPSSNAPIKIQPRREG